MTFDFNDPGFWLDLGQIILVNIALSGDNAVVIALSARTLPSEDRNRAIIIGSFAAIAMRVGLTFAALQILDVPFLKLLGSFLLIRIAVKLSAPRESTNSLNHQNTLLSTVKTILMGDLFMSLDNVLAVAAAANGDQNLLIAGLAISIPIVIFGSTLILRIIERFPVTIQFGAGMLGYVAGEMLVTEPAFNAVYIFEEGTVTHQLIPIATTAFVLLIGNLQKNRGIVGLKSQSQESL